MMLALKSGPKIAAKVGNPAGLLCQRIWYSVGKSGVLGITEYRQGRPLTSGSSELAVQCALTHALVTRVVHGILTILLYLHHLTFLSLHVFSA